MADVRIAVLLGEICDEEQKQLLGNDVIDGLLTCPSEILHSLSDKLGQLPSTSEKSSVEDELVLTRAGDQLSVTVLCRPTANGLASAVEKLLTPPTTPDVPVYSAIIYAGLFSEASAHWLLPNYVFTPTALSDLIQSLASTYPKPADAENQPPSKAIHLHVACNGVTSGGEWRHLVGHQAAMIGGHSVQISVNRNHHSAKSVKPTAAGDTESPPACDPAGINAFVTSLFAELPATYCSLTSTPLVSRNWSDPTLKVARPCLYVFPEGSGQAAIFALPGYNILVNAGCAHHPSFWPVANYLDRLDAVLLTHWGVDNLLGLVSVLPVAFTRSAATDQAPDCTLCLLTPPPNPNGTVKFPEPSAAQSPFALSIPREISKLMTQLKQQGTQVFAQPLTRGTKMVNASQPVQLYQKVGQGSLELFPLTPSDEDSAELRKVADDWAKAAPSLTGTSVPLGRTPPANKFTVPLLSHTSLSALVIWKPAKDTDAILRLLFVAPNAHQARILVSLEALAASSIYLRHARAVPSDFERKRSTVAAPPGSARRSVFPSTGSTTAKAPSVNSAGSAPSKPAAGRPSTMPSEKKPAPGRPGAPHTRPSTKPTVGKKEATSSAGKSAGSKAGADAKKVPVEHAKTPTAASHAAVADTPHESNGHDVPVEPHSGLSPTHDAANNLNGYHAELNGADAPDDMEHASSTAPTIVKSPMSATQPLSEDLLHLDLDNDASATPDRNHSLAADEHGAQLLDPTAAWGDPQGLPAPPMPVTKRIGSTPSAKQAPIQYAPGCTDASSHAAAPGSAKLAPYDKVKPIYVDVAFLPGGGNPHLVDAEWFKRVRARYYVATDPRPGAALMEALTVGKESWTGEDAQLSASLILAHETEELMIWLGRNSGRLAACHLELAAVAGRSSIQLMNEQQTASAKSVACAGYRIDF